jgi:hypothetical protein
VSRFRTRSAWLIPITVTALVIAAGVAYASIPDGSGVIHACYKHDGDLRFQVINAPSQTCP